MAEPTPYIYNDDVAGLIDRVDRFLTEVVKSASSNITEFVTFDVIRLQDYIAAMRLYIAWVIGQPQLDLPETHPMQVEIGQTPEIPELENPMVKDAARLLWLRQELANSQSARRASGLTSHDVLRAQAVIEKTEKFLTDYVAQVSPVDLPESSPNAPMTGHGAIGV